MTKSKREKAKSKLENARSYFAFLLFTFAFLFSAVAVSAQRDYLTNEEIELIRDAQQIDLRIDVLTNAIDRRFAVLNINVGGTKKEGKDWGALPTGTRTELLADIKQILQKAIDDIDNLSSRPDSMVLDPNDKSKKPKGFSDLFPKAVRKLAAAATRYNPALKQQLAAAKDEREKGLLLASIEMCDDILASVSKLK